MRCEFLTESKPYVFLECGTPHIISPRNSHQTPNTLPNTQQLETEMEQLLERLAQRIIAGQNGVKIL
jgi:hypothetical protein